MYGATMEWHLKKTLSLFTDDEALLGWRYRATVTDLTIPPLGVWRLYRGRADCENRNKELKTDFGLGSFVLRDFWVTESALVVTMLLVGTGLQGKAHLEAFAEDLNTRELLVTLRSLSSAQALTHYAQTRGLQARVVPDADAAVWADCPLARDLHARPRGGAARPAARRRVCGGGGRRARGR